MITDFDLLDLSAVFVLLRYNIADPDNSSIVSRVISVLSNDSADFKDNQIRVALASTPLHKEGWEFIYHNNLYVKSRLLKDKTIYSIFIKVCTELKIAFDRKELDKAYDLLDGIHCLPEIIFDNQMHITKSYWKTHIYPYRKKWNLTFLQSEQKEYLKRNSKRGEI